MALPADMHIDVRKRDNLWTIIWSSSDNTSGTAEFHADSAPELTVTLVQRIIESHDAYPKSDGA